MSLRLRLAVLGMRATVMPYLARVARPERLARDLDPVLALLARPPKGTRHERCPMGSVPTHVISCGEVAAGRAVLWFHGGAFLAGSGRTHLGLLGRLSQLSGVAVIAPDYRLLPGHAFPAPFEDALSAWDGLLGRGLPPSRIVLGGDSAGGGLALSLLAELLARGQRPAGLLAFSPWCDLTLSGASLSKNGPRDPLLPVGRMAELASLYLDGAPAEDPRASPLFARFADPPPVLIQAGAEEALCSDSERMADRLREAGGLVELELWPGCPHVWQALDAWVPEAREALGSAARFLAGCLKDSTESSRA